MERVIEDVTNDIKTNADKMKARSERMMTETKHAWDEVTAWVKKSPVEAAGIALAAGAVVGGVIVALSSKKSSSRYSSDSIQHIKALGNEGLKPLRSAADRGLSALCNAIEEVRASINN